MAFGLRITSAKSALQLKYFMRALCTLFSLILAVHLVRILFGWPVEINGLMIPFVVSYGAVVVLAVLIYKTYQLAK